MSLLMRHTPGEWDGSFHLALEALVKDLLTDGATEVLVNNEVRLRTLKGYAEGYLVFERNDRIRLIEIDEFEVP
jgi:hypothetical protein